MQRTIQDTNPEALISNAANRPGDDPIFALNAEAKRRSLAGESIINATLGALLEDDGSLAVLPTVFDAFRGVEMERAAAYAPIAGDPEFLSAVRKDVFGESELASSAIAVATPGGTGALHHAIVNFLDVGQALLVPEYFWGPYSTLATHTGRAVETFSMFDGDGRFDLRSMEEGLARICARQGRALLILNFPCNNPTGYSLDAEEWEQAAEIIQRHASKYPIALVVDLAYAAFGDQDATAWRTALERVAECATVMVAWTVSKSMAQYGARVGCLLAYHQDPAQRVRIGNALSFSCRGTWSNCNHLGLLAVTRLLEDPELRARAEQERAKLVGLLGTRVVAFNREAESRGLRYPRYEGGFFVSVFTEGGVAAAERMREDGVFVVPMEGAVRVALCSTPAAAIPRLVESLARAVR